MIKTLLLCIIGICTANALFFGGGGGCGCQPQQSPCAYSPPQCSCPAPTPCYSSSPIQQYQPSYALQTPQVFQQQAPSFAIPQQYAPISDNQCQPKYIIVRPAEQVSQSPSAVQQNSYQVPVEPSASEQIIPSSGNYKSASRARASKTVIVDARCNSAELRQLLDQNIVGDDANESKRRIHKAANELITTEGDFLRGIDVICAPGAFSYRISTDFFCEHAKGSITCFAYQQHN